MSIRSSVLVASLFFLICCCWAVSSPTGSSPDDEYHLQRIWCSSGDLNLCAQPSPGLIFLPKGIVGSACYAFNANLSADCQRQIFGTGEEFGSSELVIGAFYPSGYARVMSLLATTNVNASVLVMRIFNSALFALCSLAVSSLLKSELRKSLWMSLSFSLLPLGFFIIPSVNPSSWAFTSSILGFFSLYGAATSPNRKFQILNGVNFFCLSALGLLARSDSVLWITSSILIVGISKISLKHFARMLRRVRASKTNLFGFILLPILFFVSGLIFFLNTAGDQITFLGQGRIRDYWVPSLFQNFSNLPSLVLGSNGFGPLGWMDTPLPVAVSTLWLLAFGLLLARFFDASKRREKNVLLLTWTGLCALVMVGLARLGLVVGEIYQPRYFTPGVMLCIGLMCIPISRKSSNMMDRSSRLTITVCLVVAMFLSIHTNLTRYTNGLDTKTLNPDPIWWRDGLPSPIVIAVISSGMFAFSLFFVLKTEKADDRKMHSQQ